MRTPHTFALAVIGATLSAPYAAARQRSPIPGIVTEDAVGFGDDVPPLDIMQVNPIGVAALDVLRLELCS